MIYYVHPVFGDRHLSNISEKVYHCQINFVIPTNRNESLEIKAQRQNFIDIVFQINDYHSPDSSTIFRSGSLFLIEK